MTQRQTTGGERRRGGNSCCGSGRCSRSATEMHGSWTADGARCRTIGGVHLQRRRGGASDERD